MAFKKVWPLQPSQAQPYQLDVSIYISEKSQWQEHEIQERLIRANRALATCNVGVQNVYVHDWLPSQEKLRVDDYVSEERHYDGIRHAALKAKQVAPIKLFYFSTYLENFTSGPALPLALYPDPNIEPVAFNTAWFPYQSAQRLRTGAASSYSEEAHELGHILLQVGHDHSGQANIMANDSQKRAPYFTKAQCSQIINHPSVIQNLRQRLFPLFASYNQRYGIDFYMNDWCSRNTLNLSQAIAGLFDWDILQARTVYAIHQIEGQSIRPQRARKSKVGWKFHAFLLIDGYVLDLDYGKSPQIVEVDEYLQAMFGDQAQDLKFQLRDPLDASTITYLEVKKSFEANESRVISAAALVDSQI